MPHLMVYLDEFGHIGQFVSRYDKRYKTSPVFGLAGIAIPIEQVRPLAMLFFKLKNDLLKWELGQAKVPPYEWEKKGSALFTVKNVTKYRQLRRTSIRLLNALKAQGGFVFYTGIEKDPPDGLHSAESLYFSVLRSAIKKINTHCDRKGHTFSILLDSVDSEEGRKKFRLKSVASSGQQMFGDGCFCLAEPAYQLESHLYQTMQCADWVCAIVGRIMAYECTSTEFEDYGIISKYFKKKIIEVSKSSSFRKRAPAAKIISLPD